jgi:hypothetical protein
MHAKHWNGGNLRFLVLVKRETHRKLVHLADRRQLWPGRFEPPTLRRCFAALAMTDRPLSL